MNTESLTIESLARALQEIDQDVCRRVNKSHGPAPERESLRNKSVGLRFDQLNDRNKALRYEQAKLIIERIMR